MNSSLPLPRPSMAVSLMQWPSQLLDSVIGRPQKSEPLMTIFDNLPEEAAALQVCDVPFFQTELDMQGKHHLASIDIICNHDRHMCLHSMLIKSLRSIWSQVARIMAGTLVTELFLVESLMGCTLSAAACSVCLAATAMVCFSLKTPISLLVICRSPHAESVYGSWREMLQM